MKFKVTKIAAAVATSLGVSAVGMNVASADAILFPYFAVSDTVTSIVTTINRAAAVGATTANPHTLHYQFYYKAGAAGNESACDEFDVIRATSPNDIVTFDLLGEFGDDLGVLAEPANRQIRANYNAFGESFALMRDLTPARGFLIVDNEDAPNVPFEPSLAGEIMVVDFAEGAVWGYQAYNAAPDNSSRFSFADAAENAGEVIAGDRAVQVIDPARAGQQGWTTRGGVTFRNFPNGRFESPGIPVGILPIAGAGGDVFTRFFVTPINHSITGIDKTPGAANPTPQEFASVRNGILNGQLSPTLRTQIRLQIARAGAAFRPNDVMFTRDELPVSGQQPRNVVCVGSVPVESLLTTGALREIGEFGGWSNVVIRSPDAMATFRDNAQAGTPDTINGRTDNTNQAIVIKLEFNPTGQFANATFPSSFNNAIWLRSGYRESIRGSVIGGLPQNRLLLRSVFDSNFNPIDVAQGFVGEVSIQQ